MATRSNYESQVRLSVVSSTRRVLGGAQTCLAAKESLPSNPDKGEIVLAGFVLIPTAVEPATGLVYVTLVSGLDRNLPGKVLAVDPASGATAAEAVVGKIPTDVKLSPDGRTLYVANCGSATVTVHDPGTLGLRSSLTAGVAPVKLAVTPDSGEVLVTNRGSATVSVWDAQAPQAPRSMDSSLRGQRGGRHGQHHRSRPR